MNAPSTGTTAPPLLDVRGLQKFFPITQGLRQRIVAQVRAVDGVDFTLGRGETLGIVGESGCGKSTVARMLVNLERPTAGEIRYRGEDITGLSGKALKAVRRNIQMVFQDPYTSLNPRMTVGDIIGEPYEIHPEAAPKGDRRGRVRNGQRGWRRFFRLHAGAADFEDPRPGIPPALGHRHVEWKRGDHRSRQSGWQRIRLQDRTLKRRPLDRRPDVSTDRSICALQPSARPRRARGSERG